MTRNICWQKVTSELVVDPETRGYIKENFIEKIVSTRIVFNWVELGPSLEGPIHLTDVGDVKRKEISEVGIDPDTRGYT